MEPHRQQPRKTGVAGGEPTSRVQVETGHAVARMETSVYLDVVAFYREVVGTGMIEPAPSSPPVLTQEEEAVARRFLAEGGGEAKTRLHKKMQSGF